MKFSKFRKQKRKRNEAPHSTTPGRSSCPKDDALRTAHTGRERERERERERAPAQNNREAKPEQLNFSKTDLLTWT
jgi:hypothetical protein